MNCIICGAAIAPREPGKPGRPAVTHKGLCREARNRMLTREWMRRYRAQGDGLEQAREWLKQQKGRAG
jgi:hypothetical protein